MSEENVRLGVIGLGGWGKMLANASTRAGNVDLVRCFARTKETRDSFSQEFDCKPAESYSEILNDDEVDGLKDRVINELLQIMMKDPTASRQATYLIFIAHNLERIADRSTNIAEDTIFLATGKSRSID